MWKCAFLGFLLVAVYCEPVRAQGKALLKGLQGGEDSEKGPKDVEGVIWEYKVMEHDEKDRS